MHNLEDVLSGTTKVKASVSKKRRAYNAPARGGQVLSDNLSSPAADAANAKRVNLHLNADMLDDSDLFHLKEHLSNNHGNCYVYLHLASPAKGERVLALGEEYCVSPRTDFFDGLKTIRSLVRVNLA